MLVMLAVALVAFAMFRHVGDPVASLVGQDTPPEVRAQMRRDLGLEDPVVMQFAAYVGRAVRGEFGISYREGRKVSSLIAEKLPATIELSIVAALFALGAGIPMGVYSGLRPRSALARLFQIVSLVGISLPTFLIGIILILVFGVLLKWLPTFGRGDVTALGWWSTGFLSWSGIKAVILPAVTLGLFQMTLIMRLVRAEMLEVLRADFVKFARARGLTDRAVHFGHALRSTLVPVITVTGLQLGAIIAFAIITETVFQWPGLGFMFLQSVQRADIPVMSTYLVLIGLLFVLINLVVDLLYFAVDPRIRLDRPARG
ncbi:MAG: ABC transporter permease [Alphaproteobacteria bacterium]|nr:ABC transporter permease [Alphaproteobacteria bacterium]